RRRLPSAQRRRRRGATSRHARIAARTRHADVGDRVPVREIRSEFLPKMLRRGFPPRRRALTKLVTRRKDSITKTWKANVKDGIEDTGPRMTRRTLLAAAPLAAAPFKSSLENSNSRWDGPGGTAREVNTSNFAI